MSEIHRHWLENCSDDRIRDLLNDANRLQADGKPIPRMVEDLKAEADARGIGASFKPWYF